MMEKKQITKAEYIKQFERDEEGSYKYTGPAVTMEEGWKRRSQKAFLILVLCLGLQIISGCLPAEVMKNTFYVILPFGAGIGAVLTGLYHLYEVYEQAPAVPEYIWQKHGQAIGVCLSVHRILCYVCAAGILFYLLTHSVRIIPELVPAVLQTAAGLLSRKAETLTEKRI